MLSLEINDLKTLIYFKALFHILIRSGEYLDIRKYACACNLMLQVYGL